MKIGAHKIKPCGKYFNDSIYVHKYFASKVKGIDIHHVHNAADFLPKDFEYDLIRYDKNTRNVSFIQLIGFDTADVPLVGDSYLVRSDIYAANRKDGKKLKFTRMKDDPQIKLHKWLYVPQDYKKFDWSESVAYSQMLVDKKVPNFQKLSEFVEWMKKNKIDTKGIEIYVKKNETKKKDKRILKQEAKDIKQVYRLHLINANLDDDSDSLSTKEMYDYCMNHIGEGDREWYGMPKLNY